MIDFGIRAQRRATIFEELASSLDAGIPFETALATAVRAKARIPSAQGGAVATLQGAVPGLDPLDVAVLAAAEHAGSLSPALRDRAAHIRTRLALERELLARLLYPAFLTTFALTIVVVLARLHIAISPALVFGWLGVVALLLAAIVWTWRRVRRDPGFDGERLPFGLGRLAGDLGATPYLEALASLVGAGVRIDEAHRIATRAAGTARSRARLYAASGPLDAGATFASALETGRALDADLRASLATAEQSGDLEGAARRLGAQRRERLQRGARVAVRALGSLAFVLAAVLVGGIVIGFYSKMLGLGLRR